MTHNKLTFLAFFLVVFFSIAAHAMRNPAAVYCNGAGYSYVTEETPKGSVGICRFNGADSCNAWDFIRGKCGEKYSYCSIKRYSQKAAKGLECGSNDQYAECLLCVLRNGSHIEVTDLMNLSFYEGVCGDGLCVIGEEYLCPQDCVNISANENTGKVTSSTMKSVRPQGADAKENDSTSEKDLVPEEKETSDRAGADNYLIYVLFTATATAAFIYYQRKQKQKITKQREDFIKWKEDREKLKS
jgi:putative hemolysin